MFLKIDKDEICDFSTCNKLIYVFPLHFPWYPQILEMYNWHALLSQIFTLWCDWFLAQSRRVLMVLFIDERHHDPGAPECTTRMPVCFSKCWCEGKFPWKKQQPYRLFLRKHPLVIINFLEEAGPFKTFQERGKETHKLQTQGTLEIAYTRQATSMV